MLLSRCSFVGAVRHGQGLLVVDGALRYKGGWVRDVQQGRGECQVGVPRACQNMPGSGSNTSNAHMERTGL